MSDFGLQLSYRPDDEYIGELIALVKTREFSGKGSAWFDRQQVRKKFVSALRAYPLSMADLPLIEGGYFSREAPTRLEQSHLRIAIGPYGGTGTLLVHVDLATEWQHSLDLDLQQSVTARFLTNYNALERFAGELEQILDGQREVAFLTSTVE